MKCVVTIFGLQNNCKRASTAMFGDFKSFRIENDKIRLIVPPYFLTLENN